VGYFEGKDRMSKKMTPWFPSRIKPVHVGVYETDLDGYFGYSFWNGKRWGDTAHKPELANEWRGMQQKKWRGFEEKQA
jgi:hypothetical protein